MQIKLVGGDRTSLLPMVAVALLVVTGGCSILSTQPGNDVRFQRVTEDSGLEYRDVPRDVGNGNAGVYVTDFDRDGYRDVLAVGGDRPALFRNTGGGFSRVDTFPAVDRRVKSAVFVDVDGDGWEDLVLFGTGDEPVALRNEHGTFERADFGLGTLTYPLGAAVGDSDGDGDHDLLVVQSGDWKEGKPAGYFDERGHVADDNGNPNVFYENTGGEFERREDAGFDAERWSLAASFVDANGDGHPDVHVTNDYNNDTIYLNDGNGTFSERLLAGSTARNGMASEISDVNGDGHPDVFVSNIYLPLENVSDERYERLKRLFAFVVHSNRTKGNTLLVNDGDGQFVDEASEYGVRQGGWGWAASFADLDNDGDRDLLHTTQNVVRIDPNDPHYTYTMVWERQDDGFVSLDSSEHGFEEHDGRGMVTLDYDRDGDLDVVVAVNGGAFEVYENTGAEDANSLEFRVVRGDANVTAIGATVRATADGRSTTVYQLAETGYLSQESRVNHVGLGDADRVTLRVTWPDGTKRTFESVEANQRVLLTRDGIVVRGDLDG